MGYTISDLEERAGVKARTIRGYVRLGYINPPRGRGTGAEYDEEQLLQAVSVVRMRAQGAGWTAIAESIPGCLSRSCANT
jgi:DNA-binding transcriptional MerR regulator